MSKFQQRLMCFETNSSSMHTLQISEELMEDSKFKVNKDGYVHVQLNTYYGRDFNEYKTQEEKLRYICTWMYIYYGCDLKKLKDGYEWGEFIEKFCQYVNDHMNPKQRNHRCEGIKITRIKTEYTDDYGRDSVSSFLDHQSQPYGSYDTDGFILDFYDSNMLVNFIFNPYMWLRTESD